MKQTTYHVERMDCAAEEQMVRMGLEGVPGVEHLVFDLPARRLVVYHTSEAEAIWPALDGLGLGARMVGETATVEAGPPSPSRAFSADEKGPLAWALAINATLFVGELIAGLLAGSMGLVADALDMLADALVYALSLAAVGGTMRGRNVSRAGVAISSSVWLCSG